MFSCELCEILWNTFLTEHLRAAKIWNKIVQFETASLWNLNFLQIFVKGKWLNTKRKILGGELKSYFHKKLWSIYHEVLSVTWPNFTVVKYNSEISIIYHQVKFRKCIMNRSSIKKALPKNFAVFTEKYLCWSLFLNKNASFQSWNFIKKRLQQRCFPVNTVKFLRIPVLKNIFEQLFERFPTWASNITSNTGIEEDIFSKVKPKKPFKI